MPITIGSNIAALKAERRLNEGSATLSRVYERLSSGQRINRAADDAAGLAIASGLNADARVFTQAMRNINDGLSVLNIGDGALANLSSIMTRLSELATQSANGVLSSRQRGSLNAEAQALQQEWTRIVETTEFNERHIFAPDFGMLTIQAGYGASGLISGKLGGMIADGTFTSAGTYDNYRGDIYDQDLADFNSDGIYDLVVAGYNSTGSGSTVLRVRLGNGDGSFGAATTAAAPISSTEFKSVVTGDFNQDSKSDIVTFGGNGSGGALYQLLLGNGDGTFRLQTSQSLGTTDFSASASGDLNGDGALDFATAYGGAVLVALGNGNGSFKTFLTASNSVSAAALGEFTDLNNDGFLDLVGGGLQSSTGTLFYMLNQGNGTFGSATTLTSAETNGILGVTSGDIDSDGDIDLITTGRTDTGNEGAYTVFLRSGSGSYTISSSYSSGPDSYASPQLGDLNDDGKADLVLVGSSTVNIALGNGNGTFQGLRGTSVGQANDTNLVDLTGDGILDIVTSSAFGGDTEYDAIVLAGNATSGVASLKPFSLTTANGALNALTYFTKRQAEIAAQRSIIGAFQSRLEIASRVLQTSTENAKAAEGRIRDVDVAEESAVLTRTQILQQAASAVLGQANQQPALALTLLGR